MAVVIKVKKSETALSKPTASDIAVGEVALNAKDQRIFVRDASGDIITVGEAGGIRHESSAVTFKVTVATKDATHRYNGSGSSSGYKIDGSFSPTLILAPGNTYKFDQADSSNSGHPLLFYYEAAKTTAYSTGVTTSGTPGSSGAYTQIVVSDSTPLVLHYQCSSHGLMGNQIVTNTRNYTGTDTDDISEGSSNLYFTNARADARITNALKDEDNMASDSATHVPSQQSVKAYVDGQTTDETAEGSSNLYFTNARADARITNALKDEDNMASNSATHVPSQQSVKAYVDGQTTDETAEGSTNLYYTNARVDTHLNQSSAGSGQILGWNGSDYAWVNDSSGSSLTVQEEGSSLSTAATTLNFVGSGVTASGTGATKTITVSGGGASSGATTEVTQSSHGLAVKDCIRHNGSAWVKAQANSAATLALGVVTAVADSNTFTVAQSGRFQLSSHGLTVGQWYYLSADTAGGLVTSEPSFSQPLVYVESANHVFVYPYRPTSVMLSGQTPLGIFVDEFTGNGSTAAYTLSGDPLGEKNTQVFVNGVYQEKATYSISGTTLTFDDNIANGSSIEVVRYAATSFVIGAPDDNSVTTAKIVTDAVTTAKIADDAVTTAKIADDAITSALIADDAVGAAAIADNSVDIARLNVTDGSSGQLLKTNGSGTLSFTDPPSGMSVSKAFFMGQL